MKDKLDLKIGTKEQKIWEDIKKQTLMDIENYEKALIVQRGVLEHAEKRIEEEKTKLDS